VAPLEFAAMVRLNRVRPRGHVPGKQVWNEAGLLILAEKERTIVEQWGVADVEFVRVQLVGPKNETIDGSFWLVNPGLILDYVDPKASSELRTQLSPEALQTESYLVLRDEVLSRRPVDGRDALIRPLHFEDAILFRDDLAAELEGRGLVMAPLSGPLD
jgi:hypothetical protein